MKTILFPTDFTDSASAALDWATLLSRQYNATLVLLHARQFPVTDAMLPNAGELGVGVGMGMMNTELVADLEPIDREQLDKLATQLRADGLTCQTEFRWGSVTDAVITAADDLHADLVVIGRGHLDNFFERLVGTEATGVARKAHCPVLVVPTGTTEPARLHTILFTTSLEFDQPAGFGQVVELAHTFGAALSVLHVHAENQPAMANIQQMTAQLQQQYGPDKLVVKTVAARTVTGGIDTYLKTNQPDLIVMTYRERDFLTGLLNPSLTGRMVVLSDKPILVYHAHGDL